ncbi:MAG: hypothetical protein IKY27_09345 [Bacteroidales bacterium]|nr:hypothetical protein [Bacteroidales bacterium]
MLNKYISFICLIFLSVTTCIAQTALHQWTTHTPGLKVINVERVHEKIYAATPYEVFYYNTGDNSINKLSKVNGLSDFGISVMRYNAKSDLILIAYSNANIDIIDKDGNITNINDIKNKNILADKNINDIYFVDDIAYICCGFGIVAIDLKKTEIKDTYIIGDGGSYLSVNDMTLYNDRFYAATTNGVYYADYNNSNLADFSQWTKDTSMIHDNLNYSEIETFNGKLLANYSINKYNEDTLFVYNGTAWDYFSTSSHAIKRDIKAYDDKVLFVEQYALRVVAKNCSLISYFKNIEPFDAIYDANADVYWIGDRSNSLIKMNHDKTFENIAFNGPYNSTNFDIEANGNEIWVAAGGYTLTWAKSWMSDGIYYYKDYEWFNINKKNTEAFDTISDMVCLAFDPKNSSKVYVGSYHKGILEFENHELKNIYNTTNSSLGKLVGYEYVYITGLGFDSKNNLWVANSGADKRLSVKTYDNNWHAFNIGSSDLRHLIVDANDYKWILTREGHFIVYNDNNTPLNPSDDIYKIINTTAGHGGLPEAANCMAVDQKGTVWVGTNDGLASFSSTKNIFQQGVNYDATRILVPRNDGTGQADYLLSGESVMAIAVDGANNLWVGTKNGVFYIANNGLTEYHHFTEDNSPLLSNNIQGIAIDDEGNIFFATDKGIISYKGVATEGKKTNSNVIVYPNPVEQNYSGLVGIKNLVQNSLVKITTIDGSFVTHIYSEGGQAVWDCTAIDGNRVSPGIYLIFVSDTSGKETFAAKILIK